MTEPAPTTPAIRRAAERGARSATGNRQIRSDAVQATMDRWADASMATKAIRDGERWAYRVAANAARSIARREAASIATVAMVESAFEAPDGLHAPCDNGKVAEASHRVLRAMLARRRNLLRDRQLEVTLKMTERGMTFHRAAKELGMTRYNMKRSFRSALRRLAKPRSVSPPNSLLRS